jgi:hypothetical protein
MRALFCTLLLANVAFFAWAHWIDAPQSTTAPPAQEENIPTLALAPRAAASTGAAQRCRTLGPFAEQSSAQAAALVLRGRGITSRDRSVDGSVEDGYWVYIGDLADADAQRRALAQLQRGGIQDASAMADSEHANRVSVGIFSEQARAVRRAEQVRALGFKPVLDLHQRVRRTYWLDMDLRSDQPEPPVAVLQGAGATAPEPTAAHPAFGDCPASDKRG